MTAGLEVIRYWRRRSLRRASRVRSSTVVSSARFVATRRASASTRRSVSRKLSTIAETARRNSSSSFVQWRIGPVCSQQITPASASPSRIGPSSIEVMPSGFR